MAKVSFSKFGLKKKNDISTINLFDQNIDIIQYLPIQDKLNLITKVIQIANENSKDFYNPGQVAVIFKLEIIKAYTNISFTKAQLDNFTNTFDLLESNGVFKIIMDAIPESEIDILISWLMETISSLYEYNMSAYGILNSLRDDYGNLNFNIKNLQEQIKDPESLKILKDIAPLLDLA